MIHQFHKSIEYNTYLLDTFIDFFFIFQNKNLICNLFQKKRPDWALGAKEGDVAPKEGDIVSSEAEARA